MTASFYSTFEFRGFSKMGAAELKTIVERALDTGRVVSAAQFGDTIVVEIETPTEPDGELHAIARDAWLGEGRFAEIETIVRDKSEFDRWRARSELETDADDIDGEDDPGESRMLTSDDYEAMMVRIGAAG